MVSVSKLCMGVWVCGISKTKAKKKPSERSKILKSQIRRKMLLKMMMMAMMTMFIIISRDVICFFVEHWDTIRQRRDTSDESFHSTQYDGE